MDGSGNARSQERTSRRTDLARLLPRDHTREPGSLKSNVFADVELSAEHKIVSPDSNVIYAHKPGGNSRYVITIRIVQIIGTPDKGTFLQTKRRTLAVTLNLVRCIHLVPIISCQPVRSCATTTLMQVNRKVICFTVACLGLWSALHAQKAISLPSTPSNSSSLCRNMQILDNCIVVETELIQHEIGHSLINPEMVCASSFTV
jgi:hypothetical protein